MAKGIVYVQMRASFEIEAEDDNRLIELYNGYSDGDFLLSCDNTVVERTKLIIASNVIEMSL
jgi:hypothetical protein